MKRVAGFVMFGVIGLMAFSGAAATLPGAIGDDYLHTMDLERVTVGVNFEDIERFVDMDGAPVEATTLDATSYSLFLGYDLHPWLTLSGTLGRTEDDSELSREVDSDWLLKWSVGLNANLGKWDIRRPRALMGDRLTIKCFVEYADYRKNEGLAEVEWNDLVVALPIAYERYERNERREEDELFRLSLYAGPILSLIDGHVENGFTSTDFEQSESLGVVAGADIYLTSSITIGGQMQLYDADGDDVHARGSFRYHF